MRALPAPPSPRAIRRHPVHVRLWRRPAVDPSPAHPIRRAVRGEGRTDRGGRFRTINLALDADGSTSGLPADDNERVVAHTRDLAAGETLVLFQPRLLVALGSWDVRGDIDVLRLSRDPSGALHVLIADIKSSTSAKVEHRLQVAFYSEMVAALLAEAGIAVDQIDLGILYRGPTDDAPPATASDRARRDLERTRARDLLGVEDGLLELVDDAEAYRGSVRDLVTGERSTPPRHR